MLTPEQFAEMLKSKYGEELYNASKRHKILDIEIALAGYDPQDQLFRSKISLALLPKRARVGI